jgi:hypothetical protein
MDTGLDNSLSKISASPESAYTTVQRAGATTSARTGAPVDPQSSAETKPDRVTISEEALRKSGLLKDETQSARPGAPAQDKSSKTNAQDTLELENLKRIDHEVRAHEQAHTAAGGALIRGAATYGYATGPDGKMYAVSGEVSIDSSPVQDDPSATIFKMIKVTKAALAPAQPSGQDRSVATAAIETETAARQEITRQQLEKAKSSAQPELSLPSGAPETQKSDTGTQSSASDTAQQTTSLAKHINIQT